MNVKLNFEKLTGESCTTESVFFFAYENLFLIDISFKLLGKTMRRTVVLFGESGKKIN